MTKPNKRRDADIVGEILALEAEYAAKTDLDVDSKPGPPASEAAIAAAEKARGRKFPASYRAFLKRHDGWEHFEHGMTLNSTDDLVTNYERGYIEEMIEDEPDEVPKALWKALTIGWSEHDARLFLLFDNGTVVDWLHEELDRHRDIDALIRARRDSLRSHLAKTRKEERGIAHEWDPAWRANQDAALEKRLVAAMAKAPPAARRVEMPAAAKHPPAAVRPQDLVAKRGTKIAAEVALHLVLYLGAFPSRPEVIAAWRAWRARFPVEGELTWMPADVSYPETAQRADDETIFSKLRIAFGQFGARGQVEVARDGRIDHYIFNLRGVPADDEGHRRASFCEVIVPAGASHEALEALARDLVGILPVRSGHAGYATYVWDKEAEPDPDLDLFDWCRRFWGVDVGIVDGWLPGALSRLRGASWLTILGRPFAKTLAKRVRFDAPITTSKVGGSVIIRAGNAPSLIDIARGEHAPVAEVQRAIAPLLVHRYDKRGWTMFGSTMFTTQTSELGPMGRHRATRAYLNRWADPTGWLAPTGRERAEELLRVVEHALGTEDRKTWKKHQAEHSWDFYELLRLLYNAARTAGQPEHELVALEHIAQFDTSMRPITMCELLGSSLNRNDMTKARALLPAALEPELVKEYPGILHNAACVYARLGQIDRAMRCVEQAKKLRYDDMKSLRAEPDLAALHKRPAWKRVFGTSSIGIK